MLKGIFCITVLMLLCSSCVSRTITKEVGLNSGEPGKTVQDTKLIWIWDKDFSKP